MSTQKDTPSRTGTTGLVFVGCLFLGLVAGYFLGNVAMGILGGLGVGFIAMAIMRYLTAQW